MKRGKGARRGRGDEGGRGGGGRDLPLRSRFKFELYRKKKSYEQTKMNWAST